MDSDVGTPQVAPSETSLADSIDTSGLTPTKMGTGSAGSPKFAVGDLVWAKMKG